MDRLEQRLAQARRALDTLDFIVNSPDMTDIIRDATIQRFEYSFEATWKAAREYLRDREGTDAASPKGVIRSCREFGMLGDSDAMAALDMVDDRNLTVHAYNDDLAALIAGRIPEHARLLRQWLNAICARTIDPAAPPRPPEQTE